MPIDGFRFVDTPTRRIMKAWRVREPVPSQISWTELGKPLTEARIALISTAGIARLDDEPFDQEREHRDPWWGDPTHRVLPREVTTDEVGIYHLHMDTRPASEDLDCVLPLRRLDELVQEGLVGSSAPDHYSIMGYSLRPEKLVEETAPQIAQALIRDQVDLALLVPI